MTPSLLQSIWSLRSIPVRMMSITLLNN